MAELPPYRNILTDDLNLSADIKQRYTNVITQVYPLKADLAKLQAFCDRYLNFIEPDAAKPAYRPFRFAAAAPLVILQVAHYGNISAPELGLSFAQNEVAFGFPVEWYDVDKKGNETFRDWFLFYPFIFVDDAYSRLSARQEYGWPKAGVKIDCRQPNLDLDEPSTLVSVSRELYPVHYNDRGPFKPQFVSIQPYPDADRKLVRFLEVTQKRPFLTGLRGVSEAVGLGSRAVGGLLQAMSIGFKAAGDALAAISDLRQVPERLTMLSRLNIALSRIAPHALGALSLGGKSQSAPAPIKIVTVKQFRDTEDPTSAVYQAVVGSTLNVTKIHDGGALFDPIAPDISGGIEIKLLRAGDHRHSGAGAAAPDEDEKAALCREAARQPNPLDQLGIETCGFAEIEDCPAYLLKPILPVWSEADFSYKSADLQYWRTDKLTTWSELDDPTDHKPSGSSPEPVKYNDLGGSGGVAELAGPFTYDPFSSRLLLVPARLEKLQTFVDEYLANTQYDFKVLNLFGRCFVWMNISSLNLEKKEKRPSYSDRTLQFSVPGALIGKTTGEYRPALFAAYRFTDADWDYITENEIFGRFALSSVLETPPSLWMDQAGPTDTPFLKLRSRIFIPSGEHKVEKMEDILFVTKNSGSVKDNLLGGDHSAFVISLRQVVDAKNCDCAAYQELVGMKAILTSSIVWTGRLSFKIFKGNDYKYFPIVNKLGLRFRDRPEAYYFDNIPAVSISGRLETGTGRKPGLTLAWRAGTGDWILGSKPS